MIKRLFTWIIQALFVPKEWRSPATGSGKPSIVGGSTKSHHDVDYRGRSNLPRGIRNNNPGNVEYGSAKWQGLLGSDGRFCIFKSAKWGIRCLVYNLNNYHRKYGLKTVGQMLDRWAPPFENNTNAYALAVAREMNVGVNDRLDWNEETKYKMTLAIMRHENGVDPLKYYDPKMIREGVRLAG